jgi:phytoene synthase
MLATMRRWLIPRAHVEAFIEAMQADLTVTTYATYADLEQYMYGSAAVIGLEMLPILEPLAPEATARARALGEAFQLTNFIRDVGEDLARGRVYLPQEDLSAFGVTMESLAQGHVSAAFRELIRFEIERARRLYAFAGPGIDMVHPTSRACLRTAFGLYQGILDAVEDAHFQVLQSRVQVPISDRVAIAWPGWKAARAVQREEQRWVKPWGER